MRGRWAAGIVPRNFSWIIKDHLAVSERPGGYAPNHRKVRRQEELLWLRAQGFTRVVSLLGSTHNLHAYEELGLEWSRFPMPVPSETSTVLAKLYPALHGWLRGGERILLHQEELGDCVMGVAAGYLLWSEILPDGPRAITAMEQLLRRQMGTVGRMIVAAVDEVPSVRSLAVRGEPGRPSDSAEADDAATETKRFEIVAVPAPSSEEEGGSDLASPGDSAVAHAPSGSASGQGDKAAGGDRSESLDAQPDQPVLVEPEPVLVEPEPAEADAEPAQAEPAQAEPAQAEPAQGEPAEPEPGELEPGKPEPEPVRESTPADSTRAESAPAESVQAQPEVDVDEGADDGARPAD